MKKKILALLLALLMTAPSFLSCSDSGTNEENVEETTAAPTAADEIASEETVDDSVDENGYLKDDLPDELDFAGETINLLYWSDVENQEKHQRRRRPERQV